MTITASASLTASPSLLRRRETQRAACTDLARETAQWLHDKLTRRAFAKRIADEGFPAGTRPIPQNSDPWQFQVEAAWTEGADHPVLASLHVYRDDRHLYTWGIDTEPEGETPREQALRFAVNWVCNLCNYRRDHAREQGREDRLDHDDPDRTVHNKEGEELHSYPINYYSVQDVVVDGEVIRVHARHWQAYRPEDAVRISGGHTSYAWRDGGLTHEANRWDEWGGGFSVSYGLCSRNNVALNAISIWNNVAGIEEAVLLCHERINSHSHDSPAWNLPPVPCGATAEQHAAWRAVMRQELEWLRQRLEHARLHRENEARREAEAPAEDAEEVPKPRRRTITTVDRRAPAST